MLLILITSFSLSRERELEAKLLLLQTESRVSFLFLAPAVFTHVSIGGMNMFTFFIYAYRSVLGVLRRHLCTFSIFIEESSDVLKFK